MLIKVLDPSEKDFAVNRARFYACPKDQSTGKLGKLFDQIWGDSQGQSQLHAWMEPHAISHIGRRVSDEMDYMKNVLQAKVSCLTQDSREW